MLISRGNNLIRCISKLKTPNTILQRYSHAKPHYRCAPPEIPKFWQNVTTGIGAFMWWWVFWHLWHEYEHITGEYTWPDVSKWTNAELGIPPDDEE